MASDVRALYPLSRVLHNDEQDAIDYSMNAALQTIFAKSLREFEPLVQNYYHINTNMFIALLDDIRFLTAGVKFIRSMKERDLPCADRRLHPCRRNAVS